MKFVEKLKIKYKNFLDNIIKSNQKSFGGKSLECCDLNKSSKRKIK